MKDTEDYLLSPEKITRANHIFLQYMIDNTVYTFKTKANT